MKHLRLYEDMGNELKVGDYVICSSGRPDIDKFLSTNIGQCIEIGTDTEPELPYKIKYPSLDPRHFNYKYFNGVEGFRWMRKGDIVFFSSDRKDCEMYMDSGKYNI